ncbi:MAG: DoxX family membrane protein [Pseudomonadota bacterium]
MLSASYCLLKRSLCVVPVVILLRAGPAEAHEAWLLTPDEIEALAVAPMPFVFSSLLVLGPAAVLALLVTMAALAVETRLQPLEAEIAPTLQRLSLSVGPPILRLGLAGMLALAGTGGLPRHGTAPWVEPTLLVPDMQLSLIPGWGGLAAVQIALATVLVLGIGTRLAGLLLVALSGLGLVLFGAAFLSYAPHFAAPGLLLAILGGGAWSVDGRRHLDQWSAALAPLARIGWHVARILIGAGFVYLAVAYKLTQPTLLIAILDHAAFPRFGLPYPVLALIMTGVEIVCGALLILGRLVRPVSVALLVAISFLAVTLGETPLFHANLYGVMLLFLLAGASAPPVPIRREIRWGIA